MNNYLLFVVFALLTSCNKTKHSYDASGTFETKEILVPSEANGIVSSLNIEEGEEIKAGEVLGYIDSTQLFLKKQQVLAQLQAAGARIPNISKQSDVFKQQEIALQTKYEYLKSEQKRLQQLVKLDAAPSKQLDDINASVTDVEKQLLVIRKQDLAQQSILLTQTSAIKSEFKPLLVQVDQLNEQLADCRIISPISGTILSKYVEEHEMTALGKPLFKIADISSMLLRAYITSDQLGQLKLNQEVIVFTDATDKTQNQHKGIVEWISEKAEFTPKTIQTKNERANLVYAIKIRVPNDGSIKIGMYGEVKF